MNYRQAEIEADAASITARDAYRAAVRGDARFREEAMSRTHADAMAAHQRAMKATAARLGQRVVAYD